MLAAAECVGLCIKVVTPEVSNTADTLPSASSLTPVHDQRPDQYFEPRNTVKKRNIDLIYYPQQKHFNLAMQVAGTVVIALL